MVSIANRIKSETCDFLSSFSLSLLFLAIQSNRNSLSFKTKFLLQWQICSFIKPTGALILMLAFVIILGHFKIVTDFKKLNFSLLEKIFKNISSISALNQNLKTWFLFYILKSWTTIRPEQKNVVGLLVSMIAGPNWSCGPITQICR